MNRLLRSSVVLICALCAALGGSVFVGRLLLPPARVALPHLTDCALPCWIGIVPDQTTLDQAGRLITEVYGDQASASFAGESANYAIHDNVNDLDFAVQLNVSRDWSSTTDGVVKTISLRPFFGGYGLKLGDLYRIIGAPDAVTVGSPGSMSSRLTYFDFPITVAIANAECGAIMVDQPVYAIVLSGQRVGRDKFASLLLPWRGFARCNASGSR